jgi:hypothetical protein
MESSNGLRDTSSPPLAFQVPTQFKLQCTVNLISEIGSFTLKSETLEFSTTDFSTSASRIEIPFGPFILISKVQQEIFDHEVYTDPTFCMDLFTLPITEPKLCDRGSTLKYILKGGQLLPLSSGFKRPIDFIYENQKIFSIESDCSLLDGAQ